MTPRLFTLLSVLALITAIISLGDIAFTELYARETVDWRAQGIAQDLFDLIIAAPALLISAILFRYGSKSAFFVLCGILVFLIYTFIIFVFAVHFNRFFLLYCLGLGLSAYSLISLLWQQGAIGVKKWFSSELPIKAPVIYLWFFCVLFTILWLAEVGPATISGVPPANLATTGLLTNPVHGIDLSFLLPGFAITAILLQRRHALGYLYAPIVMTFSIVMTLSIGTLITYEYLQGLAENYYVAIAMAVFALASAVVFRNFMKHLAKAA